MGLGGAGQVPVVCCVTVPTHHLQLREHLAKGQRMLAGEGMSQVVRSLQELLARRTYYSGDLLFSVDILRNVTDTFKRATYVPSADDVQVPQGLKKPGPQGQVYRVSGLALTGWCPWTGLWGHICCSALPAAFLPGGELHGRCREQG